MKPLQRRVKSLEQALGDQKTQQFWVDEVRTRVAQEQWMENYYCENGLSDECNVVFYMWEPTGE